MDKNDVQTLLLEYITSPCFNFSNEGISWRSSKPYSLSASQPRHDMPCVTQFPHAARLPLPSLFLNQWYPFAFPLHDSPTILTHDVSLVSSYQFFCLHFGPKPLHVAITYSSLPSHLGASRSGGNTSIQYSATFSTYWYAIDNPKFLHTVRSRRFWRY